MDHKALAEYLYAHVDSKARSEYNFYCPISNEMSKFKETSKLLQILGQNTEKLEEAIKATETSVKELRAAQENAINQFKQDGLYFYIIQKDTFQEVEAESLQ
jgi:hypothetical protein